MPHPWSSSRLRAVAPGRVVDGEVIETGATEGRRRAALALPGVEPDVVVIATGGEKGGLVAEAGDQIEAERVAIERHGPVQVGHFEMDMPDVGPGWDGLARRSDHCWLSFTTRGQETEATAASPKVLTRTGTKVTTTRSSPGRSIARRSAPPYLAPTRSAKA